MRRDEHDHALMALTQMRKDIANDVAWFEGREVNGDNVSGMFGNLSAIVDALRTLTEGRFESGAKSWRAECACGFKSAVYGVRRNAYRVKIRHLQTAAEGKWTPSGEAS